MTMRPFLRTSAAALALAATAAATANPGTASYRMSVDTRGGMAGGMGATRSLGLEMGASRAEAQPYADHFVPSALGLGSSVPLLRPEAASSNHVGTGSVGSMGTPKGRMISYWGCGETVRPGNRREIDFARLAKGAGGSAGLSAKIASEYSARGFGAYVEWPNAQNAREVSKRGSLIGAHRVTSNLAPEFGFSVAANQDFLGELSLRQAQVGQASRVDWQPLERATGYFLSVVGTARDGTVIMWTSSDVAVADGLYDQYLEAGEVARLVKAGAILSPATTSCTVPAEVISAVETPMLMMSAYADDVHFSQPRPEGAPKTWKPDWTVSLRYKSSTMTMLGEAGAAMQAAMADMNEALEGEDDDATHDAPPPPAKKKKRKGLLGSIAGQVIGG